MLRIRTDLAAEAKELYEETAGRQTKLAGVKAREYVRSGMKVTQVQILDERGVEALEKPKGNYVTLTLDDSGLQTADGIHRGARVISEELKKLIAPEKRKRVLIAGLGNLAITPDSIGPLTVRSTAVTRHLRQKRPEYFSGFGDVAALETGVLATTGVESAEIVKAVSEKIRPDCVIAVDALAAGSLSRLCRTVQIADTGIVPGSGVGNSRAELNSAALGVPVIAIGVPTVVDVSAVASLPDEESAGMIVTMRDIDVKVRAMAKLVATGINLALHEGFTTDDFEIMTAGNYI